MFHLHDPLTSIEADKGLYRGRTLASFKAQDVGNERRLRLADFLAAVYASDHGSDEKGLFNRYWEEELALWLQQLPSEHTRRAYSHSISEFKAYLWQSQAVRQLWLVESRHAVGWIEYMRNTGNALRDDPEPLSDRTVNLRLAALSSFYEHMCGATRLIHGTEVGLFVGADGNLRENPFRSTRVKRPTVVAYGSSTPAPQQIVKWILNRLADIHPKRLSQHRDYALLMTFCYTGYRAETVLSMRWGDFRLRGDGDGVVHHSTANQGKGRHRHLPKRVWDAILAYLQADGRYKPGGVAPDSEMFVWQAIRCHGSQNLVVQRYLVAGHEPDQALALAEEHLEVQGENKPIVRSTATEVLRRHLRRYYAYELHRDGMSKSEARVHAKRLATAYHLHSLRHSFASTLDEASGGDVRLVSEMLDHASVKTTRLYLESIRDPEDKTSVLLEQAYDF